MHLAHHIHEICPVGMPYLVGVSGGADSIALLHLLRDAGHEALTICHLHHGLRGEAADHDQDFVREVAEKLKLRFITEKADVHSLAESQSLSLETAAREARHDFFTRCATATHCPSIILAHHADDQAETALWMLLRGSHGLRAMKPVQAITHHQKNLTLLRPLLTVRRADLHAWLRSRDITWREDLSNQEPFCSRNRLRLEALPLLTDIMRRDVVPPLLRQCDSNDDLRQCEAWIIEQAHALDPQGRIHLPTLRLLPAPVQSLIIRHYLESHGIKELTRAHFTEALAMLAPTGPPRINLPGGKHLRRRQSRLFLTNSKDES